MLAGQSLVCWAANMANPCVQYDTRAYSMTVSIDVSYIAKTYYVGPAPAQPSSGREGGGNYGSSTKFHLKY